MNNVHIDMIHADSSDFDTESYQFLADAANIGRLDRLPGETREAFGSRAMDIFSMLCKLQIQIVGVMPELPLADAA